MLDLRVSDVVRRSGVGAGLGEYATRDLHFRISWIMGLISRHIFKYYDDAMQASVDTQLISATHRT